MNRLIIDFMAKYFKIIKVRASPLAAVCVSSGRCLCLHKPLFAPQFVCEDTNEGGVNLLAR